MSIPQLNARIVGLGQAAARVAMVLLAASGVNLSGDLAVPRGPLAHTSHAVRAQGEGDPSTRVFLPAVYRAAYVRDEPPAWRFIERTRFNDIAVDEAAEAVWLSTNDGVVRYDSSDGSMAPFAVDGRGPTSAMGAAAVDSAGNVWFAARPGYDDSDAEMTAGVVRVSPDGAQRRFTTADGLAHDAVYAMAADGDGSVWFGTFRGASRLAPDGTWTTYRFRADEVGCGFGCFDVVLSIAPDRQGGVWLGRSTGVTHVLADGTRDDQVEREPVRAMAIDSGGHAWYAADDQSLVRYDGASRDVQRRLPFDGAIRDVVADASDRVWVASDSGVWRRGANGAWEEVELGSEPTRAATSIAFDGAGRAWIGRIGLLVRADDAGGGISLEHGPKLASENVNAVARSLDGTMWLGFIGSRRTGLVSHLRPNGRWTTLSNPDQVEQFGRILGIAPADDGSVWASMEDALLHIDPDGDVRNLWPVDAFVKASTIGPPAIDTMGTVWFGLTFGVSAVGFVPGGVVALAPNGSWQQFTRATHGLASDNVRAIVLDEARNEVWAAGVDGLSARRADGSWHSVDVPDAIRSSEIYAGMVDRNGNRWFVGWDVVAVLDGAGAWRVESYQGADPLIVLAVAEDTFGRIWLGTTTGLLRHETDGTWRPVAVPGGTTPDEAMLWNWVRSLVALPDGDMWVGTHRGVAVMRTDRVVDR